MAHYGERRPLEDAVHDVARRHVARVVPFGDLRRLARLEVEQHHLPCVAAPERLEEDAGAVGKKMGSAHVDAGAVGHQQLGDAARGRDAVDAVPVVVDQGLLRAPVGRRPLGDRERGPTGQRELPDLARDVGAPILEMSSPDDNLSAVFDYLVKM